MLSQNMVGAAGKTTPSSVRRKQIHRISAEVFSTALYSAFVDDLAMPFCFRDDHDIGCEAR